MLIIGYIASLYKASLETRLSAGYYALQELNEVRMSRGLKPISISSKTLREDCLKAANEYKKLLQEKGGSYVVVKTGNTEKLEFKPWLKDLEADTKKAIINAFDKSIKNNWSPEKLNEELSKIEELTINKRAKAAAFSETRVQQHLANVNIWKKGKVSQVQRHLSTFIVNHCGPCIELDENIYNIDDAPPLSHFRCFCFYTIVSFYDE
jgi:hypothetical protein